MVLDVPRSRLKTRHDGAFSTTVGNSSPSHSPTAQSTETLFHRHVKFEHLPPHSVCLMFDVF